MSKGHMVISNPVIGFCVFKSSWLNVFDADY